MLTLLVFLVVLVLLMGAVGRMARVSRRRAYEEEQRRVEEMRRNGGEENSPSTGIPFGGIFEEMLRGMETRSYRIDRDRGVGRDERGATTRAGGAA